MDRIRAMAMAQELHGRQVGGWVVEDYLGNGFSAVVLSARKGDSRAALKVIDPEMIERFGTERQLARVVREKRLEGHTHPHLVQILDAGHCSETGHLYVVMELLEPITLGDVRDTVPPDRIGTLISQLASAARFLEQHDLVHRDIKPDNTHVSSDYSNIKLLDLGVVYPPRGNGEPSAGTGNLFVGTARYSPPEFLHREEENNPEGWRAITFYQIGATLFDLISRTPIFDDFREPPARLYEAIRDHVPTIVPASEQVAPWLVDLARRCLTKDWSIRLQLITWEDFEGPRILPESPDDIRQRIRARFPAEVVPQSMPSASTSSKPSRRTIVDLSRSTSTMIREVCQQGGVFPPLELQPRYTAEGCSIKLRAGPFNPQGLQGILVIEFMLSPIDADGNDVLVLASVCLGSTAGEGGSPAQEAFDQIFAGDTSGMEFREIVDVFIHAALESALGAGEPTEEEMTLRPNWR